MTGLPPAGAPAGTPAENGGGAGADPISVAMHGNESLLSPKVRTSLGNTPSWLAGRDRKHEQRHVHPQPRCMGWAAASRERKSARQHRRNTCTNAPNFAPQGLALVRELIDEGQAHIFGAWPPPGGPARGLPAIFSARLPARAPPQRTPSLRGPAPLRTHSASKRAQGLQHRTHSALHGPFRPYRRHQRRGQVPPHRAAGTA